MNIKHDREKVLKEGVELFWCKGFSNLGVDEICKTTGMTKGAFYNAFKSKENFLLSCIEAYGNMNTNYLKEQLSGDKTKAIDRILKMYVAMLGDQPNMNFKGCMTNNIMSEIGSINEVVSSATADAFNSLLEIIEPVVQKAQIEGDISSSLNSQSVTELIHSTFFGVLTRAKSTKDHEMAISTMTLLIQSLKTI
jgi:TetR/AcrR family transcriptional repressor of nem operon